MTGPIGAPSARRLRPPRHCYVRSMGTASEDPTSRTLVVTSEYLAKQGHVDELLAKLQRNLPATRSMDGCDLMEVFLDRDSSERVILISRWRSIPHWDAYITWRADQGTIDDLAQHLEAPTARSFLELLPGV